MSGSAAPERPPEGEPKGPRVLGGYELLERIGQSRDAGTLTFRARQTSLGRTVRVIVLPPQAVAKPTFRTKFERRVAVASRLRHDNVVSLIDAGSASGCLYVVFEDLRGRTLADVLAGGKPLPVEQVVEIGIAIARGLDHVAAQGLVHRNVVPRSILLPEDGPPKLAGLGTAKVRVAGGAETWMDHDADRAAFIAPELLKGQRGVDVRADVYGLGCVLYQAATGRRVFGGGSAATILARHGSDAPEDPRAHVPSLPDAFVRVLDRCLRKSPRERYAKPSELAADLENVRAGRAVERGPGTPFWKDRVLPVPSILRRRAGG